MKKSLFIITAAVLAMVACSRNLEINIPDANLSLFARTESPADTKTVVESGVHVFWEPGDEIAVFMGEQSAKFTTDITAASGTATFKGTFGDATWPDDLDLWAVYPFSEDAVFDGETITTVLPSEQVARPGSFGKDMNLSIAHSSETTLQFYNVGGGVRFSVTEEDIKKVMFEGLSGEIISGKVKIGLEDGLPVIKEVTGGSQFITLLPPSGQDTFQPGTWYYIVAIPGSLEGGFKLRFYKDSDYARRVSEKVVVIKRSIFGNIEKADEGIDFEPQTTHFPETEEEWKESIKLTETIVQKKHAIIDNADHELSMNEITEALHNIDGIIAVFPDPSGVTVSVVQKDSVCINISLFNPIILSSEDEVNTFSQSSQAPQHRSLSTAPAIRKTKDVSSSHMVKGGGKALILSPFQDHFRYPIDHWYDELSDFFEVDSLKNSHADFRSFVGTSPITQRRIDDYDFILLLTHGSTATAFYSLFYPDDDYNRWNTMLCTGTLYNENLVDELVEGGIISSKDDVAPFTPAGEDRTFLGFLPSALDNHSFNDSAVLLMACESAKKIAFERKMVKAFRDKGASFVSGNDISMFNWGMKQYVTSMLDVLCHGFSYSEAHNYASKSDIAEQWSNLVVQAYDAEGVPHPGGYSGESFDIFHHTHCYPDESDFDYFFLSPFPEIKQPKEWNGDIEWACDLSPFHTDWTYFDNWHYVGKNDDGTDDYDPDYHPWRFDYSIVYSLHIDGDDGEKELQTTNTNASVNLDPGKYNAYVVARVMLGNGNREIASYKGRELSFSVTETPNPEELLLSRTYNGKTYSVIRKNVSSTDCRINGDGSKFYSCSYSVKVGSDTYDLPGTFYSYTDRDFRDTGPVMAVNTQTGKTYVFLIEKDTDETYGMCGHVFTLSSGSISQQTVFTYANFGWFPYFEWNNDQFLLNMFSYAQYFSIIAPQDEDWTLYYNEDIYPDDFHALQQQHDLICIH